MLFFVIACEHLQCPKQNNTHSKAYLETPSPSSYLYIDLSMHHYPDAVLPIISLPFNIITMFMLSLYVLVSMILISIDQTTKMRHLEQRIIWDLTGKETPVVYSQFHIS